MKIDVAVDPPYSAWIEAGSLDRLPEVVEPSDVAIISDTGVAPHHLKSAELRLANAGKRVCSYVIEAGEKSKTLATFERLQYFLADNGFDRSAAVVGLGGGVVGDLVGFVASSFMRGISFYLVPTTLLAMVDASIGGKTAVNLPAGKNLVGTFWQPKGVLMDVRMLATLPHSVYRAGAVEIFKHGLLANPSLCDAVLAGELDDLDNEKSMVKWITASVTVKANIVAEDVRESGRRVFLNLGHTLAHALEAASGHDLSHGEAVTYGLLFAGLLGRNRGWYDPTEALLGFLDWLQPSPLPAFEFSDLKPYIARDKKHQGEQQRFVLLRSEASPTVANNVSELELRQAWTELQEVLV
jgi:3-dehydroquinate synthase